MNRLAADGLAVKASIIKASLSIFDVLRKLGKDVEGKETQQILCPNPQHPERRPSARVYEDSNHVHCFGCGRTWDPVGVVKVVKGLSDEGAVEWLSLHFALPDLGSMAPTVIGTIIKRDAPDYARLIEHTAAQIGQQRGVLSASAWHRAWLAFDHALVGYEKKQLDGEALAETMAQIGQFVQQR
jgi:hypothetical protein